MPSRQSITVAPKLKDVMFVGKIKILRIRNDDQLSAALDRLSEIDAQIKAIVARNAPLKGALLGIKAYVDGEVAKLNESEAAETEPLATALNLNLAGAIAYLEPAWDRRGQGPSHNLISFIKGTFSRRKLREKVIVASEAEVIARLRGLGLDQYVRTPEPEVDRNAIYKDRDKLGAIAGIGFEGDTSYSLVLPNGSQLTILKSELQALLNPDQAA